MTKYACSEMDMSKSERDPRMSDRGRRETKTGEMGKPMFLRLYFYQNFSRFPEGKESESGTAPVVRQACQKREPAWTGRKDPEVSGRADQGKTGTHIV